MAPILRVLDDPGFLRVTKGVSVEMAGLPGIDTTLAAILEVSAQ
jgi:hypothetical protein